MLKKTLFSFPYQNGDYSIYVKDDNEFYLKNNQNSLQRYIRDTKSNTYTVDSNFCIQNIFQIHSFNGVNFVYSKNIYNREFYSYDITKQENKLIIRSNISHSCCSYFRYYDYNQEKYFITPYNNPEKKYELENDIWGLLSVLNEHYYYVVHHDDNLMKYNIETKKIEKIIKMAQRKPDQIKLSEKYIFVRFANKVYQYCSKTLDFINMIPDITFLISVNDKYLVVNFFTITRLYHLETKTVSHLLDSKNGWNISFNHINNRIYYLLQNQQEISVMSISLLPIFQLWVLLKILYRHSLFDVNVLGVILQYLKFF